MLLDLRNSLSAKSRCSLEADDTQGGPRHIHENNLPEANVSETVQSPHREYTSQHLIAEPLLDDPKRYHGFLLPIRCFVSLGRTSSVSFDSQPQFFAESRLSGGGISFSGAHARTSVVQCRSL
jgi:hypothetical protein